MREKFHFSVSKWVDGKPRKPFIHSGTPEASGGKLVASLLLGKLSSAEVSVSSVLVDMYCFDFGILHYGPNAKNTLQSVSIHPLHMRFSPNIDDGLGLVWVLKL
ncbi:hypothetical protein F0562_024256 [Nyssa sinensis]|uniref:Uncharacterized protein n=1 Tax=Nyssa sinensis TaxID=561372 RepID=A0A5J5BGD7_9ASTE|nr:hypothetical protein F0562_024256 [Nyssa sinensis]